MAAKNIVVLGGGFAGLWSAVGAARKLDELGIGPNEATVTLVDRGAFHNIRVRNYENDLTPVRVPLDSILAPIGVRREQANVQGIDLANRTIELIGATNDSNTTKSLPYDRLVFALGSEVVRPSLPGLKQYAFDIDTYSSALRMQEHLQNKLPTLENAKGARTIAIVGAGLTGVELACEMPEKLRTAFATSMGGPAARVMLIDHNPRVGSDMGDSARPVIERALASLGIETKLGDRVAAITKNQVLFESGETLDCSTVVWCAGLRANALTKLVGRTLDRLGRVPVDECLRAEGMAGVFAAGDSATMTVCPGHTSIMSCQHSRPMGRFAGHNVVADLFGAPLLPLQIDWYVTVLDLGPWGAVYTEGWDRQVIAEGETAKRTKRLINGERIYPPANGDRATILAAAAPIVQSPPPSYHGERP